MHHVQAHDQGSVNSSSSSTSSILTPPATALNLNCSFRGVNASSAYDPYSESAIDQSNIDCFPVVVNEHGTDPASNFTSIDVGEGPNGTVPLFASSSSSSCTPTLTLAAASTTETGTEGAYYIDDPRAPLFDQDQNQNVNQDQNQTPLLQLQAYSPSTSNTRPITPQFQTSFSSTSLSYSRLKSEVDRGEELSQAQDSIGVTLPVHVDVGAAVTESTRHLQPNHILAAEAAATPLPELEPSSSMSSQSLLEGIIDGVGREISTDPSLAGDGGAGEERKSFALTMENNTTNNNTAATRQPSRHPEPHYAM